MSRMATDDRAPLEQQSARLRLVGSAEPNLDAREAPNLAGPG
jgi:hypothetical protein